MFLTSAAKQQGCNRNLVIPRDGLVGMGKLLTHDAGPISGRYT